jgi:hypothetical protein
VGTGNSDNRSALKHGVCGGWWWIGVGGWGCGGVGDRESGGGTRVKAVIPAVRV